MADSPKPRCLESMESSYGTFLAAQGDALPSSSVNSTVSDAAEARSSLAFIDVSYDVPNAFGWLPGMKNGTKTILKPVRYISNLVDLINVCC